MWWRRRRSPGGRGSPSTVRSTASSSTPAGARSLARSRPPSRRGRCERRRRSPPLRRGRGALPLRPERLSPARDPLAEPPAHPGSGDSRSASRVAVRDRAASPLQRALRRAAAARGCRRPRLPERPPRDPGPRRLHRRHRRDRRRDCEPAPRARADGRPPPPSRAHRVQGRCPRGWAQGGARRVRGDLRRGRGTGARLSPKNDPALHRATGGGRPDALGSLEPRVLPVDGGPGPRHRWPLRGRAVGPVLGQPAPELQRTAGVWRKAAIEDAGGWTHDTLTEDLDLSYRAQLRGWRIVYRPDLVCPAELPVLISGFKSQQRRWAKGSIQTTLKLLPAVARAPLPLWTRYQAFVHLTYYMIHPLMLTSVLLSIPLRATSDLAADSGMRLGAGIAFGLATLGPATMLVYAQR